MNIQSYSIIYLSFHLLNLLALI